VTHILGEHAKLVIHTAKHCHPNTHTPDQADALMQAVLDCIDLAGGTTQATRLDGTGTPDKPPITNRTRTTTTAAIPMNPVHRRNTTGHSNAPTSDLDSSYWHHQYQRVHTHFDRCEVVRRAAHFLQRLLERDPHAPEGDLTDEHINQLILDNGPGWPPDDVARKYRRETRDVITIRIDHDRHPLTGKPWTPPEHNAFAAVEARSMRDAGLTSTQIARSLGCSASAVRMWTTKQRRAA
jgi:hypothetical protein